MCSKQTNTTCAVIMRFCPLKWGRRSWCNNAIFPVRGFNLIYSYMYLGSQSLHKIIFSFTLGGHVYLEGLGDCAIQSSCIVILETNAEVHVGECNFLSSYTYMYVYAVRVKKTFHTTLFNHRRYCVVQTIV